MGAAAAWAPAAIGAGIGLLGQQSNPSTIQSQTSLPGYAQPYHQQALQQVGGLAGQPYQPYPGPQVAGFNPIQEAALNAAAARGMQGSPVDMAAQQQAVDTMSGQYLDPMQNEPLQNLLDYGQRQVMMNYGAQLGRNFGNTGVQEVVGDAMGRALAPIYESERGRQMQMAAISPNLSGVDYRDIGAVSGAGDARQALQQRMLDVPAMEFAQARQWPFMTNQALGGLLGLGGTTQTQDNPYVGNPFQAALGGGVSGYMLGSLLS